MDLSETSESAAISPLGDNDKWLAEAEAGDDDDGNNNTTTQQQQTQTQTVQMNNKRHQKQTVAAQETVGAAALRMYDASNGNNACAEQLAEPIERVVRQMVDSTY